MSKSKKTKRRELIQAGVVVLTVGTALGGAALAQRIFKPKTLLKRVAVGTGVGAGVGLAPVVSKTTRPVTMATVPLGGIGGGLVGSLEMFGRWGVSWAEAVRGGPVPNMGGKTDPTLEEVLRQSGVGAETGAGGGVELEVEEDGEEQEF